MKRKKFVTKNYTYGSAKRIVLDSLISCVSLFSDDENCFCDCLLGKYRDSFVVYREYNSENCHLIFRQMFNRDCCPCEVFESFKADFDALLSFGYKKVEKCV